MSEVFEDGKNWRIRFSKTGTRIRSEIVEPHTHPPGFNVEYQLSVIEAFVTDLNAKLDLLLEKSES